MTVKSPLALRIKSFSLVAGGAATSLIIKAHSALAQAVGGNPFDKSIDVLDDWTTRGTKVAIAAAGGAGVVVILMAIFGYLRKDWAFRIGIGLICLSGLGWVITQLSS